MIHSLKISLVAAALAFSSGCTTTSRCQLFSSHFWIANWQDEIPTNIVLETYAVDGRFEKAVEQPIQYSGSIVINDAGKRFLLIVPKGDDNFSLAINREYEIVIDNSVEYRVSKIVSSDRPNLGCPLESAVVNTCTVTGSGRISFDQSCR